MSLDRLILREDEHLLVIRKPPGINTHAASAWAGEGIYDWLRRREPRWADLAIVQRLDKETSGVMVFSRSRRANVSLTKQFSRRRVAKEYALWSDRRPAGDCVETRSWIRKGPGRFLSEPDADADGLEAVTRFTVLGREGGGWRIRAEPLTGRTHQIRLHAADLGFPILGDTLYGGAPHPRLCLHASALQLRHPATNDVLEFRDEPRFEEPAGWALRTAVTEAEATTAMRVVHGAADGRPGWYVDRLGDFLVASSEDEDPLPDWLEDLGRVWGSRGIYRRRWERHVRGAAPSEVSPALASGAAAASEFEVLENGLRFRLSLQEGYSSGLFLDQRDNRRRLQVNWVGPGFPVRPSGLSGARVLNTFAYTCGFSVAAASAGAVTTSLDLSRKYLDWGRRNFAANRIDPGTHDFIYGDAMDWLGRLARKGRRFEVVIVDPPTFSQSREHGVFRVETDLATLVAAAAALVAAEGVLLISTNAARLEPERFLEMTRSGVARAGRGIAQELFVPQPPDHPTCRAEPAYLKTVWLRLDPACPGAMPRARAAGAAGRGGED